MLVCFEIIIAAEMVADNYCKVNYVVIIIIIIHHLSKLTFHTTLAMVHVACKVSIMAIIRCLASIDSVTETTMVNVMDW